MAFGDKPKPYTVKDFMTDNKLPNIKAIRDDLHTRYTALIKKYGEFKRKVHVEGDNYYIHVKVPSETIDKFFYDVVIQFTSNPEAKDGMMRDYIIRVHSNAPSFTFRYAYVLNKRKLTIPVLHSKLDPKSLSLPPVVTNPYQIPFYEKTLYFALIELERQGILGMTGAKLHMEAVPFIKSEILKNVMSSGEMTVVRKAAMPKTADTAKDKAKKETLRNNTKNIVQSKKETEAVKKTVNSITSNTAKKAKRI